MISNLIHISVLLVLLSLYSAYLLWDDKMSEDAKENKKIEFIWHGVGAALFGAIAYTFVHFLKDWRYAPFCIAFCWTIFAGIIHMIGLRKHFFFVGTTAVTDRMQQWLAKKLGITASNLSSIIKPLAFAGSIALFYV